MRASRGRAARRGWNEEVERTLAATTRTTTKRRGEDSQDMASFGGVVRAQQEQGRVLPL